MFGDKACFWSPETLVFYIGVIVVTYLITKIKRTYIRLNSSHGNTKNIWLILAFLVLLFVMGFRTVGRDLNYGYFINFDTATSISAYRDQSVEIGFIILNVIIKKLFDDFLAFVFIVSFITLSCVYYVIDKYSDRIKESNAVLIYTSTFFFSAFSPMRQTLAASICLLAYDSIIEKKQMKSLVLILIATSIHLSSLLMLVPYFFSMVKAMNKKMIVFSVLSAFVIIYLLRDSFSSMLVGRYSIYTVSSNIQFGFRWVVYYLPIALLLFFSLKKNRKDELAKVNISIVSIGFLFEMLEYVISIFGRFDTITLPLIVIIPYYMEMEKSRVIRTVEQVALYAYCAIRFWLFISDSYLSQNLMPYTSVWLGN